MILPKIKDNIPTINTLATVVIGFLTVLLGIAVYNLQANVYNLQESGQRASISLLVNPVLNQNWTFVDNGVYFTLNGTFSNEGSRVAIIKELDLSIAYNLSNNNAYSLTLTYLNPSKACGWDNDTILNKEIKQFSLTMFVYSSFVVDSHTGQVIPIGNSRSDTAKLEIKYNDGISDLAQNLEFNTH